MFPHASMWEHITAAVLSITVCVYGIQSSARKHVTVVQGASDDWERSWSALRPRLPNHTRGPEWPVDVCGITCPPCVKNTHAVCAMSCACMLASHLHCVRAWARIYAHHAVAVSLSRSLCRCRGRCRSRLCPLHCCKHSSTLHGCDVLHSVVHVVAP